MGPKLSAAAAVAALACLALVPNAAALGVGQQRAVAQPERPAAARAATTNPLLAPAAVCPDQDSLASPTAAQPRAMICLTNFARARSGLGELAEAEELDRSAAGKAGDVLRCDSFSHFACGREFTYWIRESGYIGEGCWRAGENLAWGADEYGSVRAIFLAWMSSPTHRRNILGAYEQVGIGLLTGSLEGRPGARVWVAHFGSHCAG
jgi:uncharacterized protein YkwD